MNDLCKNLLRRANVIVIFSALLLSAAFAVKGLAQEPVGTLEGRINDPSGASIPGAQLTLTNAATAAEFKQATGPDGFFHFVFLPVGKYSLRIEANGFSSTSHKLVSISVSETVRLDVPLGLASTTQNVEVNAVTSTVDTSTNALGKTVTESEVQDLPLNGRNFSQLGLLQAGVAQINAGLLTEGGSLRAGQSYVVNGQRPEGNNFLLDGVQNVDRMDGGFAVRVPIDAIAEFRILTSTAPPEFGDNIGSTTSVVTRSGGNSFHGSAYEFLRNELFDTRNYFAQRIEPLKQNQFGVTVGGPLKKDKLFFFSYYEGFRNRQGVTQSASVPTAAQHQGDFSGIGHPLINFAAGGVEFPNDQIPLAAVSTVARNVANLYPVGNTTPSIYTSTLVGTNNTDQAGARLDLNRRDNDRYFLRYFYFTGLNFNPVSVRGSDIPGFPTQDNFTANSVAASNTHLFSPSSSNAFEISYFRYQFLFDQRLNKTPPTALGFEYQSASTIGQGPPFFNLSGYSPVGGAITGPRTSVQNTYEVQDTYALVRGPHVLKVGAGYRINQLNLFQSIAPNGFFVFASSFPTNDAFANLLLGAPVLFYQGIGNFDRGIRNWGLSAFAQDEWRVSHRLTLNYGMRWELINPNTEIHDRLNAFVPGQQSVKVPTAPMGILFPGDPGVGRGIAHSYYKGFMPRIGFAWDAYGNGRTAVRASYGIFYDPYSNGMNATAQAPVSALPWAQFVNISGPTLKFTAPYTGRSVPEPNTFVAPSTAFVMDQNARPPNAQDWNFSVQQALPSRFVLEMRYVGTKGTHLPRNIEANPAVFGPGATSQNADRRRQYANCKPNGGSCDYVTIGDLTYGQNSTYHAAQLTLTRQFQHSVGVNVSYWYSKTLDYLSSLNLQGASAKPLSGENDLAQNPFDLKAEHGPSLFDSRNRLVGSMLWELPSAHNARGLTRALLNGWQLNTIASANSATPYTIYDSTNVSLQANSPPISGYFASRPNRIADPNKGPHTPTQWIGRDAYVRLDPKTQAGQFGDAGRNTARAPAYVNVDASALKMFPITESVRLQFRAELFNLANHSNFGVPVADLASANFGRVLQSGPPRLTQFALKLLF